MACIQHERIYTLTNCQGGTVLDLSGADNYSSKHHPTQKSAPHRIDLQLSDTTIIMVPTNR